MAVTKQTFTAPTKKFDDRGVSKKGASEKPRSQLAARVLEVPKGEGDCYGGDGSGKNKGQPKLSNPGVAKGKSPKTSLKVNSAASSPVGAVRPTQDGGPKPGQTSKPATKDLFGPIQGEGKHGQTVPKGATNKFDLYADARK